MYRFLFFLILPVTLFAAPVLRSPQPAERSKFTVGAFYDVTSTNLIIENLSLSLGYGISEQMDFEVFFYRNGMVFNLKPVLKQIDFFVVSGVFEVGVDFSFNLHYGLAIMMDMKLYDFLNIYIGAKGRYPANQYLDSTMRKESGAQFIPHLGIEFFRGFFVSIIFEGGFSIAWSDRFPSHFVSIGLRGKF